MVNPGSIIAPGYGELAKGMVRPRPTSIALRFTALDGGRDVLVFTSLLRFTLVSRY